MAYIKYGQKRTYTSGDTSTMTFGSERGKWMRVIVYKAGRNACRDDNIDDIGLHQTHLPRCWDL